MLAGPDARLQAPLSVLAARAEMSLQSELASVRAAHPPTDAVLAAQLAVAQDALLYEGQTAASVVARGTRHITSEAVHPTPPRKLVLPVTGRFPGSPCVLLPIPSAVP